MTQEEKQLLLRDLCARSPYGVKVKILDMDVLPYEPSDIGTLVGKEHIDDDIYTIRCEHEGWCLQVYKDFIPYLRPMSSMTEEEDKEFALLQTDFYSDGWLYPIAAVNMVNWLNEHHFDYRGLIEKGLALVAPDGMYNKEQPESGSEVPIPKTVDEAVKTLAKVVSKEDRDYLLENGAISVHDSMGRWIRNEWGLWTDSELKNELKKKGFEHPDDMSNYIIEEFIKYCLENLI